MKRWILAALLTPTLAAAHGGGLDANGCHTDRKTGIYHCHRAGSAAPPRETRQPQSLGLLGAQAPQSSGATRPFRSCAEARAAGAAPVLIGDPGYSARIDRDRDGVACE